MLRVLSILALTCLADAAQCGLAFALPIQDVLVLPNITNSYVTGIPISIGTPKQSVVVLPWAELNNTYVYDRNSFCDDTVIYSDKICYVRRGGLFLDNVSSSFRQASNLVEAGGALRETSDENAEVGIKNLVGSSLGGTEVINFASTHTMDNFPIGIPRQPWDYGYSLLHPLGLGRNSTYINTLYNTGVIASRVWSIYWGRMWTQSNPLNGSVVLGGYDERKTLGDPVTRKLDYSGGCFTGLKVSVTNIVLNFRGGLDRALLPANTAITTCIVPTRQLLFQGPEDVSRNFQSVMPAVSIGDSFGVHWSAMIFDTNVAFNGDITIELDSSMKVRVPNDQFVVPSVAYDRNGSRVFNQSSRDVLIGSVSSQVATLGRYFLTSSYLMVDYDEMTWSLWNANPTSGSSLKTIVRKGNNCTASANAPPTTPLPPKQNGFNLSTPVIIGFTIGIVLAIVIIIAVVIAYRKRTKKLQAQAESLSAETSHVYVPPGPQELHGVLSNQAISRLPSNSDEKHFYTCQVAQLDSRPKSRQYYELSDHRRTLYQFHAQTNDQT